jgi:hypothetical protein
MTPDLTPMDLPALLAMAAALGWASGVRLYLAVFATGLAGAAGWIPLPPGLQLLQHPAVLMASGFMVLVEFTADKVPGLDSLWDLVHTVIRIPAGAALAAAALGADGQALTLVMALLGGTLAATAHAAKATSRAAINTSPEPFSNIGASLLEDGLVALMLWLAWTYPYWFASTLILVLAVSVALTWALFRFVRLLLRRLVAVFSGHAPSSGSGAMHV